MSAKVTARKQLIPISSVRKQAAVAAALATAAAIQYATGNEIRAAELHIAAERACAEIIKAIVDLTEEEADLVEPMLTGLEEQLFTLGALRLRFSPN